MTAQLIADEHLAERLAGAERDVTFLDAAYAELRDGLRDWSDWNPELTCVDRQQAAAEECAQALDDARADLAALTEQAQKAATERRGGN